MSIYVVLRVLISLTLLLELNGKLSEAEVIEPILIQPTNGSSLDSACSLPQNARELLHRRIESSVYRSVELLTGCGVGEWHRVVNLDMTDESQSCPSPWIEFNRDGTRGCERALSIHILGGTAGGCESVIFPTNRQYNRVCGRATGYQIGGTAGFGYTSDGSDINNVYLYGLSITHGMPRTHIWSFAVGITEGARYAGYRDWECPCNDSSTTAAQVPTFVGTNYFCESGNPTTERAYVSNMLYSSDPVWDGRQCQHEGQCCKDNISPPWFSVLLPNPTSDDVEARLCVPPYIGITGCIEEVVLQKLEIFIQ